MLSLYNSASLYDLAFSYRDVAAEIDVILEWYRSAGGHLPIPSALELAAGPARHALELARRAIPVAAVDLSQSMCLYAAELAKANNLSVEIFNADISSFTLGRRYDLALTMLDSASHILSLDAMISHFRAAAEHLKPLGIYILEFAHPADFLSSHGRTRTIWTASNEQQSISVHWGEGADEFDSITQVGFTTVSIFDQEGNQLLRDRVATRHWTSTEVEAAVRLAGTFRILQRHGAFELTSMLDDTKQSWRMIFLLQRVD